MSSLLKDPTNQWILNELCKEPRIQEEIWLANDALKGEERKKTRLCKKAFIGRIGLLKEEDYILPSEHGKVLHLSGKGIRAVLADFNLKKIEHFSFESKEIREAMKGFLSDEAINTLYELMDNAGVKDIKTALETCINVVADIDLWISLLVWDQATKENPEQRVTLVSEHLDTLKLIGDSMKPFASLPIPNPFDECQVVPWMHLQKNKLRSLNLNEKNTNVNNTVSTSPAYLEKTEKRVKAIKTIDDAISCAGQPFNNINDMKLFREKLDAVIVALNRLDAKR